MARGRRPVVGYYHCRGAYYTQYRNKKYRLVVGPRDAPNGPTFLAALEEFKRLLTLDQAERLKGRNPVRLVVGEYFRHIRERRKATSVLAREKALRRFLHDHGDVPVGDVTHLLIYDFCDRLKVPRYDEKAKRGCVWGDSGIRDFLDSLSAAFNWAVRSGLLDRNPVSTIERPGARSQSRECLVTPELHARLLELAYPRLRDLLVALENTGARPGELTAATAKDFDRKLGAVVYYADDVRRKDEFRHKTAGKGRTRVIFFTGEALKVLRRLAGEHRTGPLFLSREGNPLNDHAVCSIFTQLRKKVDAPKLTAYSYRHTLATNWLMSGRSIDKLAEILGNSPEVIRRHYSHRCAHREELKKEVEQFEAERRSKDWP